MPSSKFADALLSTTLGRAVAANMLAGLRLGLYDHRKLCPLLDAWDAFVTSKGYTGEEVVRALAQLKERSQDANIPHMHIFCRLSLNQEDHQTMTRVLNSHHLIERIDSEDYSEKQMVNGIDFGSKPGHTSHSYFDAKVLTLRLGERKSLTRSNQRSQPVLWYTTFESLDNVVRGCKSDKQRADAVRDKLGLVHFKHPMAVVELPHDLTDDREDCGRPTFVEAVHDYEHSLSLFRCDSDTAPSSLHPWGMTVDIGTLAKSSATEEAIGLPERVCGQIPKHDATRCPSEIRLRVRLLKAPSILGESFKKDLIETLTCHLEDRETQEGKAPLVDQLTALCGQCREQLTGKNDGDL